MNAPLKAAIIFAGLLTLVGCGDHTAHVTGQVTCQGKPVTGSILFSPKGENESNTGPAVNAPLTEDGSYELRLKTVGKHTVVVTPRDIRFPVPAGELDYPCDRSPVEREVQAGHNDITIEMATRSP
jgi:hypothetical protein